MAINATAGNTADGASAKAAIPTGNDNTPAPTIFLTKLKISSDTVAPSSSDAVAPPAATSAVIAKPFEDGGVPAHDECRLPVVPHGIVEGACCNVEGGDATKAETTANGNINNAVTSIP